MKHLKIFENFVNEMQGFGDSSSLLHQYNKLSKDFKFAIDLRDSTKEDQELALVEFAKFAEMRDYVREYLLGEQKGRTDGKPNAWIISVSGGYSRVCIIYSIVTSSNWIFGSSYNENFITLKEFLNVGLPNVPEYITMKKSLDKYNL